ncbi:MAG: DUF4255 domain-containing protein [Deltaproteobacteria bacterium]|nr:DUF4255 domain-containing protein [Deltaproteobacteria bacterium]
MTVVLPTLDGPLKGPMSSRSIIGEVTEALHRFLLEGYDLSDQPPRVEEDLAFVPKDREEVIYVYMYRAAQNPSLQNRKRLRVAPIFTGSPEEGGPVFYHRPPLILDLFYLVMVHARFRSDAERLLGWVLLRLHEATHLIYRPRRFILPDGREIDSLGRPYDPHVKEGSEELCMEKVSLALVDDLTVGDGIHLFTLFEAPYRPFLCYRARVALDGPILASRGGTTIRLPPLESKEAEASTNNTESPSGRIKGSKGRIPSARTPPGPPAHRIRRVTDAEAEHEE